MKPYQIPQEATGRSGYRYTLGTAARATGKNKTTINRAIKSGRISAVHNENGTYEIEPAELHRVFPPVPSDGCGQPVKPPDATDDTPRMLRREVEILREERERERAQLQGTIDGLRHQVEDTQRERDEWRRQATYLLESSQQEKKPEKPAEKPQTTQSWIGRLFKRV